MATQKNDYNSKMLELQKQITNKDEEIENLKKEIQSLNDKLIKFTENNKNINNKSNNYSEGKYKFIVHSGGYDIFKAGDVFRSNIELDKKFPENIKILED
jgi:molecular chaperone GrpE (heat shock protein)